MDGRISLEDLLIRISERLLSDVKSVRVSRMEDEPYSELSETEKSVNLTIEASDIKPEDIRVAAAKDSIELVLLHNGAEKFRELYSTPAINPEKVRMRLNNGILEITADKN